MNVQEALAALKSLGKEQARKTYRRHGAGEDVYGVSSADLKSLQKKVKKDHELARALWATGNHEARILATMVADPKKLDGATLDAWAADLDNYIETGYLAGLAAQSPAAREVMERWINVRGDEGEWIAAAGWTVLSHLAAHGGLTDAESEEYPAPI